MVIFTGSVGVLYNLCVCRPKGKSIYEMLTISSFTIAIIHYSFVSLLIVVAKKSSTFACHVQLGDITLCFDDTPMYFYCGYCINSK